MYRLDYVDGGSVRGADIDILPTGDVLTAHMTTARTHALQAARRAGRAVLISRIDKAGRLRSALVIRPDGSASRPEDKRPMNARSDCKRDSGETCFCQACRAERRGRRR
jgi:hypothetical protein